MPQMSPLMWWVFPYFMVYFLMMVGIYLKENFVLEGMKFFMVLEKVDKKW